MSEPSRSLRPGRGLRSRLVLGFVAVAVGTGVLTAVSVIAGVLILADTHPIGANRVGRRVADILPTDPSERTVIVAFAILGMFLIGLAVDAALAIASRTLRPVADLAAAAERMAAGDLTVRLTPQGQDEVADLARTFNLMAGNLDQSVTALQRLESNARRFAADVSHELRTPLAAMSAVTELLSEQSAQMGPDAARATQLVVAEITHLDRLVSDLIEMSRFDAGTAALDLDVLVVADAVTSSLALRGWGGSVELGIEPTLVAVLDRRRFDVVVANLVGNAVKYAEPPIVVTARTEAGWLTVAVTDRGPGLSPDALAHVFERFYKADAARTRSDGSGLGLAIARENAVLHGGDITARKRKGGGTVFTFSVPHRTVMPDTAT